jgi:hypothetical protein
MEMILCVMIFGMIAVAGSSHKVAWRHFAIMVAAA